MAVAHTEKYLRLGTSLKLLPISVPYRLVCEGLKEHISTDGGHIFSCSDTIVSYPQDKF